MSREKVIAVNFVERKRKARDEAETQDEYVRRRQNQLESRRLRATGSVELEAFHEGVVREINMYYFRRYGCSEEVVADREQQLAALQENFSSSQIAFMRRLATQKLVEDPVYCQEMNA